MDGWGAGVGGPLWATAVIYRAALYLTSTAALHDGLAVSSSGFRERSPALSTSVNTQYDVLILEF